MGRKRLAQNESLDFFATVFTQKIELVSRLNPFGKDPQAKAMCHRDYCPSYRCVSLVPRNVSNEGLADL